MSVEFVYSFKWLQRAAARLEKFTRRHLSDGREAFLRLQMFNVRLVVRTPDHTEDGWCYAEVDLGSQAGIQPDFLEAEVATPLWCRVIEEAKILRFF